MENSASNDELYVKWDATKSDISNFKDRIKVIVDNRECKKNADVKEIYFKVYSGVQGNSKDNKIIPDKSLSLILRDEIHYRKNKKGCFCYNKNEDVRILSELTELFDIYNGEMRVVKNYEIIIDRGCVLYMMEILTSRYEKKISNISIEYLETKAKVAITYRFQSKQKKDTTSVVDIGTIDKLLHSI